MRQITPRIIARLLIAHGEGLDRLVLAELFDRVDRRRRVAFFSRTTSSW
jgi:hypothetical protein